MQIPKSKTAQRSAEPDVMAAKVARGASKLKPMSESTPEEARALREEIGNPFAPASVPSVQSEDLAAAINGRNMLIRVYRDQLLAERQAPHGALLYFHGGGFVLGNVAQYDTVMQQLAKHSGCVVMSVEYELAPECKLKGIYADGLACYQWVREQSEGLGIDPERLAIGGDSAGGNLSIALIQECLETAIPVPAYALLIYPAVDPEMGFASIDEFAEGYFLTKDNMRWFRGHYLSSDADIKDPKLRLLERDCDGFPPAYVLTAGFDPLRDEGKAFADKLAEAGCQVEHECYTDMIHAFISFGGGIEAGQEALEQMGHRLARALG